MIRLLKDTSEDITATFYVGGVGTDADGAVTVNAVDADGVAVITNQSAVPTGTNGEYRVALSPSVGTGYLTSLTVTWECLISGDPQTITTFVEIAGGFVFSLAELTAVKPSNLTWTTAQMVAMRTTVEQAIEDEYGTALVPRYKFETVSSSDGTLRLTGPIQAVRSVTVDGTAYTAAQLAALTISADGLVYLAGWYGSTRWWSPGNITVGYEYGLPHPPARVRQAAVRLARQWLVSGPIDDRALGAASPDGGFSFGLATPGRGGSIFGMPELDAVIMSSPYRVSVA